MFEVTSAWKAAYPDAYVGILVLRAVSNPAHDPVLERRKMALEEELRVQFSGQDRAAIARHPVLQAYGNYYRQFKKTYHIQLQLESIVLRENPSRAWQPWWSRCSWRRCRICC